MSRTGWWPGGVDAAPPDAATARAWRTAEARYDARIERAPWTSRALVGVLVLVHLAVGLDSRPRKPLWVRVLWPRPEGARVRWGALEPGRVLDGELWRLVSHGFLHLDWLHLGLNAFGLWGLGRLTEAVFGPVRGLWLFTASVVGGGVFSLLGGGTVLVGASGGLFGLLGALVAIGLQRQAELPSTLREVFGWRLWPWILVNLALGLVLPVVNDKAHVGGLLTGALLALPLGDHLTERRPTPSGAVVLVFALTAVLTWAGGMVALRGD